MWALYSFLFVAGMESYEITIGAITLAALAGGTITILSATTCISIAYISCLLLPFILTGLYNPFEYFYYITILGFVFWLVMIISAIKIGKFFTQVLELKSENATVLNLMYDEREEVKKVNNALTIANNKLDSYATKLESEVEQRTFELLRLSYTDALTKLQNRSAFTKRMHTLFANNTIHAHQYALLFIDLNGFKDVNDGFGHKVGDLVLVEVAKRLNSLSRFIDGATDEAQNNEEISDNQGTDDYNDCLCRWGGDEFLFLTTFKTQQCINALVNAVQQRIAEPIQVASNNITLGASIGISRYPLDSELANELIQYAAQCIIIKKIKGVTLLIFRWPCLTNFS